jgi:hypothetical protein
VDDGTWTLAATLGGYQYTSATLDDEDVMDATIVVSDDHTLSIIMTAESIPVSDVDLVTGYTYCENASGILSAGITVQLQIIGLTGTGLRSDSGIREAISGDGGLATFTNLRPGASYRIRGDESSQWVEGVIPATATESVALKNVTGHTV